MTSVKSSEWNSLNSEDQSVKVADIAMIVFPILFSMLFYLATHIFNQALKI